MKKLTLLLMIAASGLVWAQEDYLDDYNNTHTSDQIADEIITNEPIAIAEITGTPNPEITDNTPEQDMTASAEASFSEFYKKLNIPIWYRWREFSFNATIPYFMSRKVPMTELSASGLGDVSLGAGYGKYLPDHNLYLDANLSIKFPTGDEEADAGDGVTVSLTTETTDITGALSAYYFMNEFTFKGNLVYTMNGSYDVPTYDPQELKVVDAENDRGDNILFVIGMDYRWQYNLTFGLNGSYGIHTASENEITGEAMDKTIFMDANPTVKFPISLFEFVIGAKIPLYTDVPDDSWNEGNRNTAFFFRTNYRIF
jgi:hypothetical protein